MRDPDRRIGGVHALTAGSAGAKRIDSQIAFVDLDVDLFRLRQDGNSRCRRVSSSAGFCRGNALHAVDAALVPEPAVDAPSLDRCDDFFDPADTSLVA